MIGRLLDRLLRRLARSGLRRGLAGEGWAWIALAGAAFLVRRARRPDDATTRIDLTPGDRYLVALVPRGASGEGSPKS